MSWQFGRVDLSETSYTADLACQLLDPVPVAEVQRVYREYCLHKRFRSVIPLISGRLTDPRTEIIGYHEKNRLIAWSMYRIWDRENLLSDHFAWDYREPRLRLGIRSIQNECAFYRDRGYRWMYFESIEPYMLDIEGLEILGEIE